MALDAKTIKSGAQLKMVSTNELVDFIGESATSNFITVIRQNGLTQDVTIDDLELIALP